MVFTAEIDIMPHDGLLDPQGKAVVNNMKNLNLTGVQDVRMGKHVRMQIEAASEKEAREKVDAACKNLLANVIMESYTFELKKN